MTDRKVLFQRADFTLSSGQWSDFKIECDALTGEDWPTLAMLISKRVSPFGSVEGVPRGGDVLEIHLRRYVTEGPLLIVDDVWTTGGSMERYRAGREAIGAVVFARNPVADWVTPLFQMASQWPPPSPLRCRGDRASEVPE